MLKSIQALRFAVITMLLLFCGVAVHAQGVTANITGTVTDPSGAVIVNAKVTATNTSTNVANETTTNNDGLYNIRFLQIGTYKVTITAPGFGDFTTEPFTLEVAQTARIDGKLSVQGGAQTSNVSAALAPLLNTEDATIATTLDERAIANIPMVGQNYAQLALFVPGAVSTSPSGFAGSGAIGHGGGAISINGNRQQQNNFLLDGMDVNETINNGSGYIAASDAIGQVQIITSNAPAEYGNVTGGDIIAVLKSGSNQFHGSLNYYLSNYLLNANSWLNKHTAVITPRQSFTQNLWTGTFGGPIFRDKLFFFTDYTGGRRHSGGAANATVASYDMRGCVGQALGSACQGGKTVSDFSELLNQDSMCSLSKTNCTAKSLIQLYDAQSAGFPAWQVAGAHGQYSDLNQIPIRNPVWKYLFAHNELYPLPNQAATKVNGSPVNNNYRGVSKSRNYNDQFDVKVDYTPTSKDKITGRMSYSDTGSTTTNVLPLAFPSAPTSPVRGGAFNEVHTFNSSMVNEFRAGYTRVLSRAAVTLDPTGVFGLNGNSIVGIGYSGQPFAGFSALSMGSPSSPSNISSSGNGTDFNTVGNSNTGTNYTDNTFLYGDDFTWLHGKHTFKMGVQFLRYQQNNFYPGNDGSMGGFYYLGAATQNPVPNASVNNQNGYNFADSILNAASFKSKGGVSGPVGMRQWRDAYYFQDDWKVLPNLTMNLGVRYDYVQPITEVNDKMATIDPNNPSRIIVAGTPTAAQAALFPAGSVIVGSAAAGYPRSLVNAYYGSVEPRVGLSYSITPRVVLRSGFGIQNYMEGTGANLRMTTNLPFQAATQVSGSTASSSGSTANLYTVDGGFGSSTVTSANGAFNVWDKNIKPAFIGEWNLGLQYELNNSASIMVAYTGQQGQHLITANSANQLRNPCIVNNVVQTVATTNPSAACLAQSPAPYYTTPTIGYNGTIRYTNSNAGMNYNAMQVTFRQRAYHGLQYTVNYTYGHAFTNATGFYQGTAYSENYYDLRLDYGPVSQDVRHNMSWNMVYDLPLGRGRMFGSHMPLVLDEVVGGWKIAMTGVEYSGLPVNISATNNTGVNGAGVQRGNHYRPLKVVGQRSLAAWWGTDPSATACGTAGANPTVTTDNGTCAYGQPSAGTFGNGRVNSERAPGFQQYDASVSKSFAIYHENRLEFKADASNVFNQSELAAPTSSVTSSTFGQITNVRSGVRQLQLDLKYIF